MECWAVDSNVVHIAHSHMHTSTFCCAEGRFQVFLVNTVQVNRLTVWYTEIRRSLFYSLPFSAELRYTLSNSSYFVFGSAHMWTISQGRLLSLQYTNKNRIVLSFEKHPPLLHKMGKCLLSAHQWLLGWRVILQIAKQFSWHWISSMLSSKMSNFF